MGNMPEIPSLTGKGRSAASGNESTLDEIEDTVLPYLGDPDLANELAEAIGELLDEWGWDSG